MLRFTALAALALAAVVVAQTIGCCPSPPVAPPPPSPCGSVRCVDAGRDFSFDSSVPPPPVPLCSTVTFGTSCDVTCAEGLTCMREQSIHATVEAETLDAVAFPDGLCTLGCATDSDCNGEGVECARCVPHVLAGRAELRGPIEGAGVCRPSCDPFSRPCAPGYACDPFLDACLEACTGDAQCRFSTVDTNEDGIDDALAYDAISPLVCTGGLCVAPGGSIGGACSDDEGCDDGLTCLRSADWEVPHLGRCGRTGCAAGTCGDGAVCAAFSGGTACGEPCTVGAETGAEVAGPSGHGERCDPGFLCEWNGIARDLEGACLPGTYTAVDTVNTGAPCFRSSDCWSPYGRGFCLMPHVHADLGVCSVRGCMPEGEGAPGLLPGVAVEDLASFCDPGAGLSCQRIEGTPIVSACVDTCERAEECMVGWACTQLAGAPERVCAPQCADDSDCTARGRCVDARAGPCDGADRGCVCS
jgi:hypothetical protein